MATFSNCQFGPLALRHLFRERLLIGERVIGWGMAHRRARSCDIALIVVLSMVPIVGSVITAVYAGRFRRFIVLTDARLMMLDPQADPKALRRRPPIVNAPLHAVAVAPANKRWAFRVRAPGLSGTEIYSFQGDPPHTTRRLIEGLELLAADSDSSGTLIATIGTLGSSPIPPA